MLKTFKYRLYPTKKQQIMLNAALEECRWLYNHFLNERKVAWESEKKGLNYYFQQNSIVGLKQGRGSLEIVHSQVLQNIAMRVDLAFKSFFRRIKVGEKPGYPRFRSKNRYDSFTFPQSGFEIKNERLKLSKIGNIKIRYSRPLEGKIKNCHIRKAPTGKWFVSIGCEIELNPLPISNNEIGIDVGLESFATFSDGTKINNPRFFRKEEVSLGKAQRKFSKQKKGTVKRKQLGRVVSKIHERIANKRSNFAHQQSRKIVDRFGIICIEDLSINKMLHNHCFSKSISDAAWNQFSQYLTYKAEWAGRKIAKINPAYTSQDCYKCGHRETKKLSDRIHNCSCCGVSLGRDHNAALNILRLGLESFGL